MNISTSDIGEWYALFVKAGEEENVKKWLEIKFKDRLKLLVPKRQSKGRTKFWSLKSDISFQLHATNLGLLHKSY